MAHVLRRRRTDSTAEPVPSSASFRRFAAACRDSDVDRNELVRGISNAEDMHLLEGTPWVLTSNLGSWTWKSGGFYAVDIRDRRVLALEPDFSQPGVAPYGVDARPPAPDLYSSHGLDVRRLDTDLFEVFAVNHGGRQSIEVFHLSTAGPVPTMTWRGGVTLPDGLVGNAVARVADGDFLVTIPAERASLTTLVRAVRGAPTGYVLRWTDRDGWRKVDGTDFSITNGLVVSPDRSVIYVNGYTEKTINKVSLDGGLIATTRVDFMPDNLRFAPDGTLLTAGHAASFLTIQLFCNSTPVPVCPATTKVAQIDPVTMRAREVYTRPAGDGFGGGTSAIVVGDDLWVCSFRSRRLLIVPLDETAVVLSDSN